MNEWLELSKIESTDFFTKLQQKGKFKQDPKNEVESYYLGCPEFNEIWAELARDLNKSVLKALKAFCPADAFIYVMEPWHQSYKFKLTSEIKDWKYDVIGGRADSVYFTSPSGGQGSYFDYDTSTFTVFGQDMIRAFQAKGCPAMNWLYQKNGKTLLNKISLPHLARHKHLFL